jgi:HPt (histidine-containing phosphotransfer) domain-containing protein
LLDCMMTERREQERRGEDVMTQSSLLALPSRAQKPVPIDEEHLGRMTLGDRSLEREVLEIFARQSALMLARIMGGERARTAAAAHTLTGSARGIGAWRVAQVAGRIEQAVAAGDEGALGAAVAELEAACSAVQAAIGARFSDRAGDH